MGGRGAQNKGESESEAAKDDREGSEATRENNVMGACSIVLYVASYLHSHSREKDPLQADPHSERNLIQIPEQTHLLEQVQLHLHCHISHVLVMTGATVEAGQV